MKMTKGQMNFLLGYITDTGAPFDEADTYVGLFTAIDDQEQDTELADLTQATGAVATRQLITAWGTRYIMEDGRHVIDGPLMTFAPASSAEAQVVIGWFMADAIPGGLLKAWGYFPDPISLPDQYAHANIVPRITIDPLGRWSAEVVYNG